MNLSACHKEPKSINFNFVFSNYILKRFIKYVKNNGLVQFWEYSKSIYIQCILYFPRDFAFLIEGERLICLFQKIFQKVLPYCLRSNIQIMVQKVVSKYSIYSLRFTTVGCKCNLWPSLSEHSPLRIPLLYLAPSIMPDSYGTNMIYNHPSNLQLLKGSIIAFFTENFPPNFLVHALHRQKGECGDKQGKWSKI